MHFLILYFLSFWYILFKSFVYFNLKIASQAKIDGSIANTYPTKILFFPRFLKVKASYYSKLRE